MILREILEEVREKLDDESTPYLWADKELLRYANRAERRLAEGAYLISDATTAAVCQIALTLAAGADYTKHSKIVKVRQARILGQTTSMGIVDLDWLQQFYTTWQIATPDLPKYFSEDLTTGKITFIPAPGTSYTANLIVYRLPLNDLVLTALTASPEIPEKFQKYLMDGILSEAYLKQDAETFDKKLAMEYYVKFTANISKAFRENYQAFNLPGPVALHRGYSG